VDARNPSYQFFWWPRRLPRILVRALLSFSMALVVVILVGLAMPGNVGGALHHAAVALMLTPIVGLMWFIVRMPTTISEDDGPYEIG
jgi:hypothetical protein